MRGAPQRPRCSAACRCRCACTSTCISARSGSSGLCYQHQSRYGMVCCCGSYKVVDRGVLSRPAISSAAMWTQGCTWQLLCSTPHDCTSVMQAIYTSVYACHAWKCIRVIVREYKSIVHSGCSAVRLCGADAVDRDSACACHYHQTTAWFPVGSAVVLCRVPLSYVSSQSRSDFVFLIPPTTQLSSCWGGRLLCTSVASKPRDTNSTCRHVLFRIHETCFTVSCAGRASHSSRQAAVCAG